MISQGLKRQIDFGSDSLGKLLAKMAVPAIIAMVVNGLYYLMDTAFVGWGVGSGAPGRLREVSLRALGVSTIMGILMYLLPLAAPELTMHLFTDDPLLIAAGVSPLQVALCALPVLGIQILGFTLFQALGRPVRTLVVSLSRQLLFLVPLLVLLPMIWGIDGLWAAFPAADVLSVLLTLLMVRTVFAGDRLSAVAGEVR